MLEINKCCLVLIDVQEKLARVINGKDKVIANCKVLVQTAKVLGMDILWAQQYPKALGQTVGAIREVLDNDKPFDKFTFSCCGDEEFAEAADKCGKDQFILCGIEAHVCVYQTAMGLLEKGKEVYVAADAAGSRTEDNKQIAIERMKMENIKPVSTEMVIFELLKTSKHPNFRELSALIK